MGLSTPVRKIDFLLLGGGVASATAAETLRLESAPGRIVIVSAESLPPYQRPPLSKRLLFSEAPGVATPVLKPGDYEELGIELLLGTRALGVSPSRRIVRTDRAGALEYGRLLIATGARPLRLPVPGGDLAGVHVLRDIGDALALREAARAGQRAVVVGSSFIGVEVSSSLRRIGIDVTLLSQQGRIFDTLRAPEISRFFADACAAHGIHVRTGEVAALEGDGHVAAVLTADGARLPCDFVVLGIGVAPEVGFLAGSGIELREGVLVDDRLRASVPEVFAAGDVAEFDDPVFKVRHRVEHWDNAVKQGKLAARNMLGQNLRFDEVSSFYCHALDTGFQFIGMPQADDERVTLGSPGPRDWALVYLHRQIPRALFTSGRPAQETQAIRSLIRYGTHVGRFRSALGRPGFSIAAIPTQTVLVLQGGGAMGAFEAGVVQALEHRKIHPDVVAGVSIGAFNGAIVASHPRHAGEALESFWRELAVATPALPGERARRMLASWVAMFAGVPRFFRPRWFEPACNLLLAPTWTSLYDTAPLRALLVRYVDFAALRRSPVRLLCSGVDVENAELRIFDSHVDDLGVDHIVASGSLPPAFPWTTIGGRHYWDGGIVSNSPLEQVVERCGVVGKRVFVVDLFPAERPLPANLMDVSLRRDEIAYAERVRRSFSELAMLSDFRKLVDDVMGHLDAATAYQLRQQPRYTELMNRAAKLDIVRIVRPAEPDEPAARDFDFSADSVAMNIRSGLAVASRVLRAA